MSDVKDVIARQLDRSGNTLLLALEPVPDAEFYAGNASGFSAAWTVGHLACVADLFSSWLDDGRPLLLPAQFHAVFNDTGLAETDPAVKTANAEDCPKATLLLAFRQAMVKALRVLRRFDIAQWDAPGGPGVPVSLLTGGAVWEILAVHVYWHCGELAGSMPRFFGTYALNTVPHYFYIPEGGA